MRSPLRVLVTRPAHQVNNLSSLLIQFGAEAVRFSTIEISPSAHCQQQIDIKNSINQFDIALFVSSNAVSYGLAMLDSSKIAKQLKLGVIGKGSLDKLVEYGLASQAIPAKTYNSEGLLDTALLSNVDGSNIIIFRGQEGRNLLGDTLQERGAKVTYCEVYQRRLPTIEAIDYQSIFSAEIDVVIFTSSEGMLNAFKLLQQKEANALLITPWLLISERMKKTAYNLGHNSDIIIANQASDDGIISALKQWMMP